MGIGNLDVLKDAGKNEMEHAWPVMGQCLFGPWQTKKGMPQATQYRTCIHPNCKKTEERPAPNA